MSIKSNLFFFFCYCCTSILQAQTTPREVLYIDYDNNSCMKKYEYRFSENQLGNGYMVYHLYQTKLEHLVLEVGIENKNNQSYKPALVKKCNEVNFDEALVRKINNRLLDVYIVRKTGEEYNVSKVALAGLMEEFDNKVRYKSIDYGFDFDVNSSPSINNISDRITDTEVYYINKGDATCSNAYYFRKIPNSTCKPYSQLTYIPGIGITEEKTGLNDEQTTKNYMTLTKINGHPYNEYMDVFCRGGELIDPSFNVTTYKTLPVTPPPALVVEETPPPAEPVPTAESSAAPTEELVARAAPVENRIVCSNESRTGVHVVQQDETLLGIARRNGVLVSQIRAWNNMKDDQELIYPCTELAVTEPVSFASKGGATLTKTVNINPKDAEGFHTVQEGETVASIAKAHGYTIEKLMGMNDMTNTMIFPGQQLKTSDCVCPAPEAGPTEFTAKGGDDIPVVAKSVSNNYITHKVQAKETLFGIAKQYKTSVKELLILNDIDDPTSIGIGTVLRVR